MFLECHVCVDGTAALKTTLACDVSMFWELKQRVGTRAVSFALDCSECGPLRLHTLVSFGHLLRVCPMCVIQHDLTCRRIRTSSGLTVPCRSTQVSFAARSLVEEESSEPD